ncbi:MAG: SIMPL domain-containing protein [Clostridia bacterium]|nr:SIMPL domain-containing protein [Clostridia bacterium]
MTYPSQPQAVSNYYPYTSNTKTSSCADLRACKLKVEGKGSIQAQPNMAIIVLGVITENRQLTQAQEENTSTVTAVLRTLREMGVPSEDIQTQSYTITPQYDFVEGKQVFRGYRVEHSLEITMREINKIGEVIDAAVQSGANQISSIRFSVSDPSGYYQRALNAAVEDALMKARTLGSKLNVAVSQIPVQIVEVGFESGPPIIPMVYQTAAPATPIQSGQIEIIARIEAVFAYRPKS